MNHPCVRGSILGREIDKRLAQLGLSRREFARRANIGRQTLQDIIHDPTKRISARTFMALDNGLKWEAGVSKKYHEGIETARDVSNANMTIEERIDHYLHQILQRLAEMDIDQLEREVILLEEESGTSTDSETSQLIGQHIEKLVASLLRHEPGGNVRDGSTEASEPPESERTDSTFIVGK